MNVMVEDYVRRLNEIEASELLSKEVREEMIQAESRKIIKELYAQNYPEEDRNKMIREIMMWKYLSKNTDDSQQKAVEKKVGDMILPSEISYANEEQTEFGCSHYKRGCMLISDCCNQVVCCRFCHDLRIKSHAINRYATKLIACMTCLRIQPVSQSCQYCNARFGDYYCDICKLWILKPETPNFHCDKCGLCRVGDVTQSFHCDVCNLCMGLPMKGNHRCIDNLAQCSCPVCSDMIATSHDPISMLTCGHAIHTQCLDDYCAKNNYVCPICHKSLGDMTSLWKQIDSYLSETQMPEPYRNRISTIFCYDCENLSEAKYHFVYMKCQSCGGYNTREATKSETDSTTKKRVPMKLSPRAEYISPVSPTFDPHSRGSLSEEEMQSNDSLNSTSFVRSSFEELSRNTQPPIFTEISDELDEDAFEDEGDFSPYSESESTSPISD